MLAYRSLLHTKYAISICGNRDQSPFTKIQIYFYSYTWVSEGKKESISPPNFRAPAQKWAIMLSPKTVHKFLYKIPDTHSVWETDTNPDAWHREKPSKKNPRVMSSTVAGALSAAAAAVAGGTTPAARAACERVRKTRNG